MVVDYKYLQAAFTGLKKLLQQEWQFLQRVMKDLSKEFGDIKETLQEIFLTALFGGEITNDNYTVCEA
jgi:hypothetical protein